jgi:glycosyltransferase involved in cell wall biosynthesis
LIVGVDGRELQGRPTGTGRYLRNLLRRWSRRDGSDRVLVYFNGPAPADAVLQAPGIESRPLGSKPTRGLLWQEWRLPRAARRDRIDVFFSPAYTCPLGLEAPRVTTVHDLSFFSLPDDFDVVDGVRRRLTVSASIRASAAVLTISDFIRREIGQRFPEAAARVVHLPLGPDDDLPMPPSRESARSLLRLRGPLILTVGSIFNRRRFPELLRAFDPLARRRPGAILDVVGENRTEPRIDLSALVSKAGLHRRVRLSGYVDEEALAVRYAAADAAVFLSEYEGFGLPVLEAICRGIPVVVSRRPAMSEIFGEASVLADPDDVADVTDALDAVLGDPALRESLRSRGLALAARFSWEETARRTWEVLATAAARRP